MTGWAHRSQSSLTLTMWPVIIAQCVTTAARPLTITKCLWPLHYQPKLIRCHLHYLWITTRLLIFFRSFLIEETCFFLPRLSSILLSFAVPTEVGRYSTAIIPVNHRDSSLKIPNCRNTNAVSGNYKPLFSPQKVAFIWFPLIPVPKTE